MILTTYEVDEIDYIATPEACREITLDSQALDIFTDFQKTEPLVIDESLDVVTAEDLMKKTHVRLKLVMSDGHFVGTLAYADLVGEKMMALSHHTPRSQILVSDIMTPKDRLKAIRFDDLKRAKVKDVVEALRNEGSQHFLVVDEQGKRIRGIISASDIARRLHVPLDITKVSTFMDIYKVLDRDRY
ncbi:CBS domain [Legionella lansingensis]|uniref:CBS domain protein n=1 Tax=Legionella lansingensis TaxID=45067 RepID=A0A0W0VV00_9GAMM|nr:CBS domain-containing protein [Legionella lansingensis]KTD23880.1 CBS domain protein [Legionella lansingensis]SNV46512.1 CBS domain [Legionella lansingensis]